jgi:hypothetical protein
VTVETIVPAPVHELVEKIVYVVVPLAWKLFVRLEESVSVVPTIGVGEDSVVASMGATLLAVSGSQGEVAPLLFTSPE